MDLTVTTSQLNNPDSANSSPRSRPDSAGTWDDPPPQPLPSAKLRLMCSYGGHIIPRPHDKSLCYVGGETRIVVVDRHSSLAELHSRLSHSLLSGRRFTLKYQLPTEDLDSLISIATDEDLENMIDEYDRTTTSAASPLKPSRLRLFLFPSRPETAVSMGCLLDDAKSETWFVDALNGSVFLPRGLSDSAAVTNNLLELDDVVLDRTAALELTARDPNIDQSQNQNQSVPDLETAKIDAQQDVIIVDSPPVTVLETNSSFGSSSSSPSMSNLPPIKVRVQDQLVGLEDQYMNAANSAVPFSQNGGEQLPMMNHVPRAVSDDEKSINHAPPPLPSGLRKPPLPLQPGQRKLVDIHNLPSPDSKIAAVNSLPSPDSVASDECSSMASAGSFSNKQYSSGYQFDAINRENRVPNSPATAPPSDQIQKTTTTMVDAPPQPQQEPISNQLPTADQFTDAIPAPISLQNQQFTNHPFPNPYYNYNIHHHPAAAVSSTSAYYQPVYHHLPPQQHQIDPQQYAMYLLPPLSQGGGGGGGGGYDPDPVASGRPLTPPPNHAPNAYAATGMTTGGGSHLLVQVPHAHHQQFQQQQQHYIGLSQIPQTHSAANNANYRGQEYAQEQIYYGQSPAMAPPPPLPQYQSITPAAAAMYSHQLPTADSNNTPQ